MQTGGGRRAGKSEGRRDNGKREEGCRLKKVGEKEETWENEEDKGTENKMWGM